MLRLTGEGSQWRQERLVSPPFEGALGEGAAFGL